VLPNMVQYVVEVPTAPQHADSDLPHWVGVLPTVSPVGATCSTSQ
jgi:hypothetical protein